MFYIMQSARSQSRAAVADGAEAGRDRAVGLLAQQRQLSRALRQGVDQGRNPLGDFGNMLGAVDGDRDNNFVKIPTVSVNFC